MAKIKANFQYIKFCAYGFFKNLRFFEIFFVLYLKEAGLSYLSIGLLYSIRQVTINMLEIPSGLFADTFSRKRALLFAIASYIVSFIVFYFSRDFHFLAAAMILYGFGEAFRSGTHKAIILSYLKKHDIIDLKTQYYGSTRSWSQLGSALVSLMAAGFYYFGTDFRTLFLFTLVPYVIDFLIIASYPSDLKKNSDGTNLTLSIAFKNTIKDFVTLFKSKILLKAMFSSASYIAFFKATKDYLQPLLFIFALQLPLLSSDSEEARKKILFGLVYFVVYLLTSFVSKNAWRLEEKVKNQATAINLLYLVGIGSVIASGVFAYFDFKYLAVILFIFLYLVQNARRPLMVGYLSDVIEEKIMASGLSASSQLETILIAIFAPLLGFLIDWIGLGGGLAIAGVIFITLYPLVHLKK